MSAPQCVQVLIYAFNESRDSPLCLWASGLRIGKVVDLMNAIAQPNQQLNSVLRADSSIVCRTKQQPVCNHLLCKFATTLDHHSSFALHASLWYRSSKQYRISEGVRMQSHRFRLQPFVNEGVKSA
jgi:hypothetical protein